MPVLAIIGVTALCLIFLEALPNISFLSIPDPYMACELSVIFGAVAGCWFLCQRRPVGFVVPMVACLLYGASEYFVETFKNAAIMPSDLRNASTGLNVAGGYQFDLTTGILVLVTIFCIAAGLLSWLRDPFARIVSRWCEGVGATSSSHITAKACDGAKAVWSTGAFAKKAAAAAVSAIIGVLLIVCPVSSALGTDWEEEGVEFDYWDTHKSFDKYGIIPSFIAALHLEELEEPIGYTAEHAADLQAGLAGLYDEYVSATPEREAAVAQFDEVKPNVIMIVNESFSDLSFLGGLGVGYDGPSYFRNFSAIAKGATSVSVYGGGTCNSEFEGLTGTSLGYVGGGINPYAIYDLSKIDALPKQFKELGYQTTAIHPEVATNWGRDEVYPAIGFDGFIDRDGFEGAERFRDHVRDSETYDVAIDKILSSDEPQFIFDLTMMGHGGYETGLVPESDNTGYDFEGEGVLDEYGDAYTNEYLSSIKMSDKEFEALISKLSEIDEPTVVAFYGDHQPGFTWWLQEKFADDSSEIAYKQSMFKTDYFVWANYHVAGSAWDGKGASGTNAGNGEVLYQATMAPANIMGWTKSLIGAPLSDYEKASYMSRWWIQSNNIYGYMDAAGMWHPMSDSEALSGSDVYEEGMSVISESSEDGLPDVKGLSPEVDADDGESAPGKDAPKTQDAPEPGSRQYQDAVMVEVMKWITYMNFVELLR